MVSLRCLKWAISISAVLWVLILWPVFAAPFLDVCLKITGTRAEARIALDTLSFGRMMLYRDETGDRKIVGSNHHVAVDLWQRPILQFAIRDRKGEVLTSAMFADAPILRIRFISSEARRKAQEKILDATELPLGLELVRCLITRVWAGD